MDLHDAAVFFDNDSVYDGYTGSYLFDVQVASFNDATSDGATNRRRVLSTGPDVVMPDRRVVALHADLWLVGIGTSDGFDDEVIRQHFTTKRATDLVAQLTPNEACNAAVGVPAYVQKLYFRDDVNPLTDSSIDAQWNVFIAPNEPARRGSFLRDAAGRLYRVRNDYLPTEGLRILQTDELDPDALQACVFDIGTRDVVTETYTAGTMTVNGIRVEIPKFYRFKHVSDERIMPGDTAVFLPSNLTVRQGMSFTMAGERWRVMAHQTELDAQVVHARLA